VRLAIDVMGGDHAPGVVLEGVIAALPDLGPDDQLTLVGPRAIIESALRDRSINDPRLVIADAPDVIAMHESPVEAVRLKPGSSIVRMCMLASPKTPPEHRLDGVLSAGNTGACVAAATMHMKRLPGVHRPGIAVTLPTFHGPIVVCDAGANPEPRPLHLAQYGVMAETYASHVLKVKNPRVAQLNIGAEEAKGTRMTKLVRDLLTIAEGTNYIGYIEGRDLFDGAADVIVTDGFVGNTILKLAEGLSMSLLKGIGAAVLEADPELALRMQPIAQALKKKNDYQEYGGAPLLGVNGVCIICHGSARARMIQTAILQTRSFVATGVNAEISQRLTAIAPLIEPRAAAGLTAAGQPAPARTLA
jgi:glycerol-3-phosphate acyltransferase PlsX